MSTDESGDGICGESFGVNTSDRVDVGNVNLNRSEIVGGQNSVRPRTLSLQSDCSIAKIMISLDQYDELITAERYPKAIKICYV